jgi:hypothetical protein
MIPVLLIGRGGSRGFPKKNVHPVLGRPLMTYPILAARHSESVDGVWLSTDDSEIASVGREQGCHLIERPAELAADSALVEDVVVHGYRYLTEEEGHDVEIMILLFCNSATIRPGILDEGVEVLRKNPDLDSAVTVSRYNEYSPARAKRIDPETGMLEPFVPLEHIPNVSCDRDTQGDCWFCDCSAWLLRPSCMDLEYGTLPFRWMGRKSHPLIQEAGLDVDYDYGMAQTEFWLRKHGFTEERTPYDD